MINIAMELAGQFFLSMPVTACRTRDGQSGVLFALREAAPAAMFPDGLTAVWVGAEAQAFLHDHTSELRPGRGVRMALNHLVARDGVVRSRVQSCELLPLPPSWQKNQSQTANPAQTA